MPRERLSSPTSSVSDAVPPSEDRSVSVAPAERRTLVLECEKESVSGSSGRGPVFKDPDDVILGRVEEGDRDLS